MGSRQPQGITWRWHPCSAADPGSLLGLIFLVCRVQGWLVPGRCPGQLGGEQPQQGRCSHRAAGGQGCVPHGAGSAGHAAAPEQLWGGLVWESGFDLLCQIAPLQQARDGL